MNLTKDFFEDEVHEESNAEEFPDTSSDAITSVTKPIGETFHTEDTPVISIPTSHLNELFKSSGVITVAIHNVVLSLDKGSLEKLHIDTENPRMIELVVEALTEKLTPEEAMELRRSQQLALRNGIQFKIEGAEIVKEIANFTVLVPELCSQIKIETLHKEIADESLTVLNQVRPEFTTESRGLKKVLKNTTATEMLNYIQQLHPNEELSFYQDILKKFPAESATACFALSLMRHVMQYSFNVDNLLIKAILTEVLDSDA